MPSHQLPPDSHWKMLQRRQADAKRTQSVQPRLRRQASQRHAASRHSPRTSLRQFSGKPFPISRSHRAPYVIRDGSRHTRTRSHKSLEVTFRQQLLVRVQNGNTRNLQLSSQASRGRHSLPGPHLAIDNRPSKPVIQLPVHRLLRAAVHGDRWKKTRGDAFHLCTRIIQNARVVISYQRGVAIAADHYSA